MNFRSCLVLMLLAPMLGYASPRKSELLLGRWHYADEKQSCTYTFSSDGTFAGEVTEKSRVIWVFAGKWSISGSSIHYEYTQSSLERVPAGSTDEDKLVEIGHDYFVIVAFDGSHRKYHRVGTTPAHSN